MENQRNSNRQFIGLVAPVFTFVSALASLYFMGLASQHQQSIFLISAFTLWLLLPFVGLLWIHKMAATWPLRQKTQLQWIMVIVAISSLIVYAFRLKPQNAKPAFTFLVFPFVSWVIIIIFLSILRMTSGRK
jgi:hypothetical protein